MGNRKTMGLDFGLETHSRTTSKGQFITDKTSFCKRKFRWLTIIPGISASGINSLPPSKSNRPAITLKEVEARHLNENYYYPMIKPDWKPINLVLYDLKTKNGLHPVFEWLKKLYNPATGQALPSVYALGVGQTFIIPQMYIELYDGCGKMVEQWILEDAWPTYIDFQDLDMNSADLCFCEMQLRYARAYIN